MAFTTVRYGSKFPTISSNKAYSMLNPQPKTQTQTLGSLLAASGAGGQPFSFTAPASSTPATPPVSTNVTAGKANPSAGAQQQVAGGATFSPPTPDSLASDPILMQIRDLGQKNVADARAGALANAEGALIGYGGVNVPQTLKDLYAQDSSNPIYAALNDANTASAAAANPDSTLKQLALEDQRNIANIDQSENANNLYYSSHHANQLSDEATGYRQKQNAAAQSLGQLLAQANQGVLDAQNAASQQYQGELSNAYNRALDLASLLGGDPTAGNGTGTGATGGAQAASGADFANQPPIDSTDYLYDPRTGQIVPSRTKSPLLISF